MNQINLQQELKRMRISSTNSRTTLPITPEKTPLSSPMACLPAAGFESILDLLDWSDRFGLRRASQLIKQKVDLYLMKQTELIASTDYSSLSASWYHANEPVNFREIALHMSARTIAGLFTGLKQLKIRSALLYGDLVEIAEKLKNLREFELELKGKLVPDDGGPLRFPELVALKLRFAPTQEDKLNFDSPKLESICLRKCSHSNSLQSELTLRQSQISKR